MDVRAEVLEAEERIRPYIRETILEYSPCLSKLGDAHVWCKLENLQYTGAFKVRGAMNKLLSLSPGDRARGVVTASTGNHGAAVAYSIEEHDSPGIVFVPKKTDPAKVKAIERCGVDVRFHGTDAVEAEVHARRFAAEKDMIYISPYNDMKIIGGQGTIAVELERQLDRIDALFASVGGGGLISGIAGYLKSINPDIKIIGCSPENSKVMAESVKAGEILDMPSLPTLSEGTAGGVEKGAITFDLCRDLVDEFVTVTEKEIADCLLEFMQTHRMLIEGAAAVSIASYLKTKEKYKGRNVAILICGANISLALLKKVLMESNI